MGGKKARNRSLFAVPDVTRVLELAASGTRVIVVAPGGMGKSTLSSHVTRQWCSGQELGRFSHLYLIQPRQVSNLEQAIEGIICEDLRLHKRTSEGKLRRLIKRNDNEILFIVDGYHELRPSNQRNDNLTINTLISGKVASRSTVMVTARPQCVKRLSQLCNGNCILVHLEGWTEESVCNFCKAIYPRNEDRAQIERNLLEEGMHDPLMIKMAILIHICNSQNLEVLKRAPRIREISRLMLSIKRRVLCLNSKTPEECKAYLLNILTGNKIFF